MHSGSIDLRNSKFVVLLLMQNIMKAEFVVCINFRISLNFYQAFFSSPCRSVLENLHFGEIENGHSCNDMCS